MPAGPVTLFWALLGPDAWRLAGLLLLAPRGVFVFWPWGLQYLVENVDIKRDYLTAYTTPLGPKEPN